MRLGAGCAFALHLDRKDVGRRHHTARPHLRNADQRFVPHVQAQRDLRRGIVQHPVADHRQRTVFAFLRGLKYKLYRARELITMLRHNLREAHSNRSVRIVTTSVHHAGMLRYVIGLIEFRDRQRIHIKAHHHNRPRLRSFQHTDHAGLPHTRLNFQTQRRQVLRHDARCAKLLEAQFGIPVKIAPPQNQLILQCRRF